MKKVANGQTTYFFYDQQSRLIVEADGSSVVKTEYLYLSDRPLSKIDIDGSTEEVYYYHTDHLGTPLFMTDSAGQKVWSAELLPFGEGYDINEDADGNQINVVNNLRFPGQYYDAETVLHYNMMRDYSPLIGRYIEKDSIGLLGGINLFLYVSDNPINWVDRWGLLQEEYDTYTKIGGSISWRTNNPGNIIAGDWSNRHGAIGKDSNTGKFAKFPTEDVGLVALKALLNSNQYADMTVKNAINKYAPSADNNDPDQYVKTLKKLGLDPDKLVKNQIDQLSEAIKKVEGWKEGTKQMKCSK